MLHSLRTQLTLAIMFVMLFSVTIISFLSNFLINQEFEKYIAEWQNTKANDIVSSLSGQYDSLTKEWNLEFIHGIGMYALSDGYIVKVYDQNGDTVWDAEDHDMALCTKVMSDIAARMDEKRPLSNGEFVSYEYDLTLGAQKNGSVAIQYYAPYFMSEADFRFLDTINLVILFIGAISLILSLIVGSIIARSTVSPITKTSYIAKRMSEGNYDVLFEGKTKSKELDELVGAINYLAGALGEQEKLRKRLTTDVAHELRTPLTSVGLHLEAMIEKVWEPTVERLQGCYEEIVRISNLVSDLENLTKVESDNLILSKSGVDIKDIVRTSCDSFEIEIMKKNLTITVNGDSVVINGDQGRLSQVINNLLSNAIKYTYENGNIWITVRETDNYGVLIVEDDGIGIPEDELSFVFERFYRTDKSRSRKTGGTGVGLTIVKSIVTAHGGTVEAEARGKQGTRFIVKLPK